MTTIMPLPAIDFEMLADLKSKMSAFTTRFDQFILAGREQLRKETNDFAAGMAEDRLTQKAHLQAIEQIKQEQAAIEETLQVEREEVAEIEAHITEYSSKHDAIYQLKESLEEQIREANGQLEAKRTRIAGEKHELSLQRSKNRPELEAWQDHLGLKIDVAEANKLRFTYTNIGPDSQRPHSITMDVSTSTYAITDCHPELPQTDALLLELNRTRDFSSFLKQVRREFKGVVAV